MLVSCHFYVSLFTFIIYLLVRRDNLCIFLHDIYILLKLINVMSPNRNLIWPVTNISSSLISLRNVLVSLTSLMNLSFISLKLSYTYSLGMLLLYQFL